MLVTDDAGAARGEDGFDDVASLGSVEARLKAATSGRVAQLPQFVRTREVLSTNGTYSLDASSTSEKWRDKTRASNVALRILRAAKVEAITLALHRHDRVLFLDADTFVCGPLDAAKCALDGAAVAAFVPVDEGREHGTALLAGSERWRVPPSAREANTGVLAVRNHSSTARLLDTWRAAYADLSKSGFLMDQPAFRAALHATGAPHTFLPPELNCRGHQRRPPPVLARRTSREGEKKTHRTAVPLRCRGFDKLDPGVQTTLRGGAGCVVLHSHDIQE
mmetsp:Transcript_10936/g.36208  ORF Transcript_10936/g.36208 Transcript_10936/m.36208 type:complete len:278 (+) Transcript_10936:179-1012(+)